MKTIKTLAFIALIAQLTCVSLAQRTLSGLAAEVGVEWIIGSWVGTSDSGGTIELSFKPDLKDRIAIVTYNDGRSESRGMIYMDPNSEEPKYLSVNTQGAVGTGTWTAEDNKPILKYRQVNSDGQTSKMALVFKKIDAKTMEVALHDLESGDQVSDSSRGSIQFKRK